MRIRFWAAAAIAATAACAPGSRPTAENTPMTIQEWKGQYGGPDEPESLVASNQVEWESAWRRVGKDAPPLDFAKFVGVMAYAGLKPTGGYTVVFDEPVVRGEDVVVYWRVPAPLGFTTQALSRPWKARAFERPKGRVIVTMGAQ